VKVKLARTAGFCMGVHRAMDMVLTEANRGKRPIFTYGPLIHNEQVIDLLKSKGVVPVKDISGIKQGTLIIRAHGIPPQERDFLRASNLRIIDATCPRVAKVQGIIRSHTRKGYTAVIVGDCNHPEVIGLMGYANGNVNVINRPEEVADLPKAEKLFVVAQTTQDAENYREIQEAIRKKVPGAKIFDTICDATHTRQEEVRSFAGHVDGMVVVGGYHSGNTRRLALVAEASGLPTFHVETEDELDKTLLADMESVAVTAGASTPNWMIKKVVQKIEGIRGRKENPLDRWIRKAFRLLFMSNVMVALGGFSLSYAATILSGKKPDWIHPSLVLLYLYAMYVLNRFLDKGASAYNDPGMASFYRRNRFLLICSGMVAIAGALGMAYHLGPPVFLAMAVLCVLGIIYSIPLVPPRLRHFWRFTKIKDIPGSKTLSEAIAWAMVIALVPQLEPNSAGAPETVFIFLLVFTMVYVRSALFDIFQAQGDLIVGAETLPITLGEKRTLWLLKTVTLAGAMLALIAPALSPVNALSFLLLLCYALLMLSLLTYEKRWLYPGTRLGAMVEGSFFLAGLLSLFWHLVT